MAQETNDGIAYLMALKQSGAWVAPEVAKPAANTRPDATPGSNNVGERFQGAEKRRAPRYKCEGSAQIRENGKEVDTSDSSLHGC